MIWDERTVVAAALAMLLCFDPGSAAAQPTRVTLESYNRATTYTISTKSVTWSQASADCIAQGSNLWVPGTKLEWDEIAPRVLAEWKQRFPGAGNDTTTKSAQAWMWLGIKYSGAQVSRKDTWRTSTGKLYPAPGQSWGKPRSAPWSFNQPDYKNPKSLSNTGHCGSLWCNQGTKVCTKLQLADASCANKRPFICSRRSGCASIDPVCADCVAFKNGVSRCVRCSQDEFIVDRVTNKCRLVKCTELDAECVTCDTNNSCSECKPTHDLYPSGICLLKPVPPTGEECKGIHPQCLNCDFSESSEALLECTYCSPGYELSYRETDYATCEESLSD